MIWTYALPDRRVYEIMDVPHAKKKMRAVVGLMFANMHYEPPPMLAAVCKESRSLVLDRYQPLALSNTTKYVDLSRDLLLLEPYLMIQRLHRTLDFISRVPLIQNNLAGLALGTSYCKYTGIDHPLLDWKVSKSNMVKLVTLMARFPKLRSLLFVVHQEFEFEFDAAQAVAASLLPHASLLPTTSSAHLPQGLAIYFTHPSSGMVGHQTPLPQPQPNAAQLAMRRLSLPPVSPYSAIPTNSLPYCLMASNWLCRFPTIPQARTFTALKPATPPFLRPQIAHQAYRFTFDIERIVNCGRRRPHLNELLFYPLKSKCSTSDPVNWEDCVNDCTNDEKVKGRRSNAQMGDPWPTSKDWEVFHDRFHKAVVEALRTGLAADKGENAFCVADVAQQEPEFGRNFGSIGSGAGSNSSSFPQGNKFQQPLEEHMRTSIVDDNAGGKWPLTDENNGFSSLHQTLNYGGVQKKKSARRYKLKYIPPTVQGASLLWRYKRVV
ncbi:hypothetical protein SEPCBS57363_003108 [Sporothrix epigloea]|uniref:2EXR domain-containing protein n=1 Tax=Sporothrix epigloea TaxID=1892477 RepID=A0ABP0DJT6_9PEZI